VLFLGATLTACATVIPHDPNLTLSQEDAKAALRRGFEEQPANFRPPAIEVGDDSIWLGTSREIYYYANLEDPQLLQKRGRYQIELSNVEPSVRRWVIFYSQDKAFAFLDALQRMRGTRLAPVEGFAERLATVPRIFAGEQPADVSGFEITEVDRKLLEAQRSAQIRKNTLNPLGEPDFWEGCLIRGFIVFCPIIASVAGVGFLAFNAGAMAVGAVKDDTYIPPEGTGVHLAALFNERVRSTTLRDQVSKRLLQSNDQPEFPRLVVQIESARLVPVARGVAFEVTARSQVVTALDKNGTQVTHRIMSPSRKVDEWLASNGTLFREDLAAALEALSMNIVSVYMPEQMIAPSR